MSAILGLISLNKQINIEENINHAIKKIKSRPGKLSINSDKNSFHINSSIHFKDGINNNNIYLDADNYLINFDGRIDNKDVFHNYIDAAEDNDPVNVLRLYKHNPLKISELSGCFSFIIYNKNTQLIEAYRDQIGIRPLYYFYNNDYFVYSTEPEFIFFSNLVKKVVNENKVMYYILKGDRFNEETFYKNIYRLRKSSNLRIKDKNLAITRYFSFSNSPLIRYKDDRDYADHFYELFYDIIKSQLSTNDGKVSSMLSGGLDTSSITCLSDKIIKENNLNIDLKTYSITFKDVKKKDFASTYETNFINDVLNKLDVNSKIVDLNYIDVQKHLSDIQSSYPEPNYHGNKYMDFAIIDEMKRDNRNVILSGFDGDSVISHGEQYLYELINQFNFNKFFKQLKLKRINRNQKFSYLGSIRGYIIPYFIPNYLYLIKGILTKTLPAFQTSKFIKKDLHKNLPIYEMSKKYQFSTKDFSRFHLNTMNTNVWEHVFETQDLDYGRAGMEVRYPFMDKRLIDFCLRIPSSQKMHNGITRYILRNAMKDVLPKSIYKRYDKSILSPYYDYSFDENFLSMQENILENNSFISDIIDRDYVKSLKLETINLNESIIFQHIYILSKWLDFND